VCRRLIFPLFGEIPYPLITLTWHSGVTGAGNHLMWIRWPLSTTFLMPCLLSTNVEVMLTYIFYISSALLFSVGPYGCTLAILSADSTSSPDHCWTQYNASHILRLVVMHHPWQPYSPGSITILWQESRQFLTLSNWKFHICIKYWYHLIHIKIKF